MLKMFKSVFVSCCMVSILTIPLASNAFATDSVKTISASDSILPTVVSDYVDAINNKDWDTFVHSYSPDRQQFYQGFPSKEQEKNKTGILSVESINVFEAKKLPSSNILEVEPYFADISSAYTDIGYYYVGFNYTVNKESEFFYNGVKYELIATGNLNGQEYIIGHENVYNIDELVALGYAFNSAAEQQANNVVKEREQGHIVNFENKSIEQTTIKEDAQHAHLNQTVEENTIDLNQDFPKTTTIKKPREQLNLEKAKNGGNAQSNSGDIQPLSATSTPSSFKLYITGSGTITNIGFDTYAKNVLPNEWYGSWKSESLKAGAVTIKTYAWYNATYPRKPATDYGAHLTDRWQNYQHYVPNSGQTTTNNAVNAVSGIFMVNSDGKVFDAQYRAGSEGDIGTAWGGVLSQWGTQYIAQNYPEYNYYTILSYYYSFSDKSSGYIQTGNY
ncbi:SpoIID/LytB domain-containing protein [Paenibacillus sp. UASWS1643]|uniref:SpoIID/LytB domain-containing protein n=1 Tax=Paenibacillus sp. UASWS1643 TaxID=2580422 RepID=UPI0012391F0E|nr:SpoIID/LytB domain-containing protein [Paenibacillus sp. UASWS1643]KAA8746966.1 SpoIID/LytB domain-containing protein [Paenibacillus sp. UASWS1643]